MVAASSGGRDDLDEECGDIVMSAPHIRIPNRRTCGLFDVELEQLEEILLRETLVQPIRTKQETISDQQRQGCDVGLNDGIDTERT